MLIRVLGVSKKTGAQGDLRGDRRGVPCKDLEMFWVFKGREKKKQGKKNKTTKRWVGVNKNAKK